MIAAAIVIVTLQSLLSLAMLVHGFLQLSLAGSYLLAERRGRPAIAAALPDPLPMVTVQLPIFNEVAVIERLIDAVAGLRYPRDRLQVQVLDDSNDATVEVVKTRVAEWSRQGLDIQHVRRSHRAGYKAGALNNGLASAKGELIAIFDADFLPQADFLRRVVPAFEDTQVGMVQTRWGHANAGQSLLTRIQQFLLDTHFAIEQVGRAEQGCFINFNGSGGVWRAATIHDAGCWDSATQIGRAHV